MRDRLTYTFAHAHTHKNMLFIHTTATLGVTGRRKEEACVYTGRTGKLL